jgi:hypothetical protein
MTNKCKDPSGEARKPTLEEAAEVLRRVAKRAVYDESFCDELRKDQIHLLRTAGMSMVALARLQERLDLPEEELQAYLSALEDANDDDPSALKLTNTCIATCKKQTLWFCGGCEFSFRLET